MQIQRAIDEAHAAAPVLGALPAHVRADALSHVSRRIEELADEAAQLIVDECGKPLKWARAEVERSIGVFRLAAEEARRLDGSIERLDADHAGTGRLAIIRRFPRGPVLGISPFNFPLNLVAHKVAPALAVGAPIIVKPAPKTPLSALFIAKLVAETDLPAGALSVLTVGNDQAPGLVSDSRLPVISFTGSGPVGWAIKESVPRKQVVLELGGDAAAIVCADADTARAAHRIATFANYQGGQSCVSVQRALVHRSIYDEFVARIVDETDALVVGDPSDERTDVGPLIDEAAAIRVLQWVDEAVESGAELLTGGWRRGAMHAPTVLGEVPPGCRLGTDEVFGPVLTVAAFDSFDDAIAMVNSSRFGIQAGIFTKDIRMAFQAYSSLDVGGVVIDDVPSYRSDQLPYGGVKESGTGREGVRSAMRDYTDERVLVLSGIAI
jgi:aldehyde dehydrogenase (NAD+)